ncbi:MAG: zinc ABC transporter substrate-binding protein [Magnetospiraceae bacterium]
MAARWRRQLSLTLLLCLWGASQAAAESPKVLATLKPLHAIAATVMAGVDEPALLLDGNQSPHGLTLRPSQARALAQADLLLWIGPGLETFLNGRTQDFTERKALVTILDLPGLITLPWREAGVHDHDAAEAAVDPHVWLHPENAAVIAEGMAVQLAARDPANATHYQANAAGFAEKMRNINAKQRLEAQLGGRATDAVPVLTFHDGFQYFEVALGLRSLGTVTVNPDVPASARRLSALRAAIGKNPSVCILAEPQFKKQGESLRALAAEVGASFATIDPLGIDIAPGAALYEQLLEANLAAIATCLKAAAKS